MEILFKKITLFTFSVLLGVAAVSAQDSANKIVPDWDLFFQMRNIRVYDAGFTSESNLKKTFSEAGLSYPPRHLYWRAFKAEQELEMWAKDSVHHPYKLVKIYPIYRTCGDLGPKRRQGDMQIPEGFYKIQHFNPNSSYWLSFKINYPNGSDSLLGDKKKLGGDIFIHGDTVTIGCLPMTDSIIKEVYWISLLNKNLIDSNEVIPFHIFPIRLSDRNWQYLYQEYWGDQTKIQFWNSLQGIYNYFEDSYTLPEFTIDAKGYYKVIYPKRNAQPNHELPNSGTGQSGR